MKKLTFLFCLLLLLSSCRSQEVIPTQVPSPLPTPSAEPWADLDAETLPQIPVSPTQLNGTLPPISLLGEVADAGIFLYGLNQDYGSGVLLRYGDTLSHFDQTFFPSNLDLAQKPTFWWKDFDGDGKPELAVKYHTEQDDTGCCYDLVFYRLTDNNWTAVSASRDICAEVLMDEISSNWDERSHTFTLTCGGQQTSIPFPDDSAPGRLVLGHLCLFSEENAQFTVVMDAWLPVLSNSVATIRAQVLYDGDSVTFQNIRMDSFAGV